MNLLTDIRFFSLFGLLVLVSFAVAAVATRGLTDRSSPDLPPTATPVATPTVDPNATPGVTPSVSPTSAPKQFSKAEQVIDAATKSYTATIKTDKGDIVIKLLGDKAPNTVNSFVFLAQQGFFDGLTFHRVEPNFVAQGGDPRGNGTGGPGYDTEMELNDLKNTRGTLAMARAGGSTKFGSQFFINLKDNPALDQDVPNQRRFPPFAEVVSGMEVVDKLAKGDVMRSVTIAETSK